MKEQKIFVFFLNVPLNYFDHLSQYASLPEDKRGH